MKFEKFKNNFIPSNNEIFIGSDSKQKHNCYEFCTVIGIRQPNKNGVKLYYEKIKLYSKMSIPERLVREVAYSIECYNEIESLIKNNSVEIHIDVNNNKRYKSHNVYKTVIGMVKGLGVNYKVKPQAHMATSAADYFIRKRTL